MQLTWRYNLFNELSPAMLYAILQLRNEVFVVEQNCVYQDADNKDYKSFHLSGWDGDILVAYCRILPPGISFQDASIGRVVSNPLYRKTGSGRALMALAVQKTREQFNCSIITIGAQLYLKKFYESFGFKQVGHSYLEDNIPHIEMRWNA